MKQTTIRKTKFVIYVFVAYILLGTQACFAKTYYVATNGNDIYTSTQAQNFVTPWKTIQNAALIAVAGDIVLVRGGVYMGDVRFRNSGSDSQPITFKAYPGEKAIIDLNGKYPATEGTVDGWWFGVISLLGNYNVIDGFEIRNGTGGLKGTGGGQGVEINGSHNTVQNCIIHNFQDAGVRIIGSYETIDGNQVYDACLNNLNGTGSNWGSGISIHAVNDGTTLLVGNVIKNNIVHDVWGEGIYGYYGISNTLLDGNIVYNSFALGIGLSGSFDGIIRNNLVYKISDGNYAGIAVVNDNTGTIKDVCSNNLVCNNFIYGGYILIQRFKASSISEIINTRIFNNTVVNSSGNPLVLGGTQISTILKNNILVGSWVKTMYTAVTESSNNYWSTTPPSGFGLSSVTDIIGDASAYLVKSPGSVASGQLTREWFKLTDNSPARDHGVPLSEIPTDAFGTIRDAITPDIGACEYSPINGISTIGYNSFQVFPNPATSHLTLELSTIQGNERVQIYNTSGILVKEFNMSLLSQQVNIENLPYGQYFIHVKDHPLQTQKFLKQ